MNYRKTRNRVSYLTNEYSSTHLNSDEIVSPSYKKKINKNYLDTERYKMVDDVLYTLPSYTASLLKKEVYYIVKNYRLKELCSRCKMETIIAVIVLFVWRDYNKRLVINNNKIWQKYNLTWEIYAKILDNLLRKTRENRGM